MVVSEGEKILLLFVTRSVTGKKMLRIRDTVSANFQSAQKKPSLKIAADFLAHHLLNVAAESFMGYYKLQRSKNYVLQNPEAPAVSRATRVSQWFHLPHLALSDVKA